MPQFTRTDLDAVSLLAERAAHGLTRHIHGDPNPRNCLVNPAEGTGAIKLIDCGDYDPLGRRVSDLALIERDIKLVLMNTDKEAAKFFDLDTSQMPTWCRAEEI